VAILDVRPRIGSPRYAGTARSCNVFSPRLRRPNAVELSMDMGYCGRVTGIFRAVGMGAQGRFSQHQRYIRHASLSRRKKVGFSEQSSNEEGDTEKGLWVHERLAHEDIDHISYTLLSVLEVIDLSNPQLIQYHMCPAETVDIIMLGRWISRPGIGAWSLVSACDTKRAQSGLCSS